MIRDDILDMLLDFVQEEDHSILVSSHITSDRLVRGQGELLQKAEVGRFIPGAVDVLHNPVELLRGKDLRVVVIHEGKVVFSKPKDELVEQYGILKCGAAQFDALGKADIIVYRKMDYECKKRISPR